MGDIIEPVLGSVGSVVGGIFGNNAAGKAADAQRAAAEASASAARDMARPWGVRSAEIGLFAPQPGRKFYAELSPGMRALFGQEYRKALDPSGALAALERLTRDREEDLRSSTRARLFSEGRLGTHSGRESIKALEEALAGAAIDRYQATQQQGFANALALAQLPTTALGGIGAAPMGATGAAIGAQTAAGQQIGQAGTLQPAFQSALATGLGQSLSNIDLGINDYLSAFGTRAAGRLGLISGTPTDYTPDSQYIVNLPWG